MLRSHHSSSPARQQDGDIPAVLYLRVSTKKKDQEDSIPTQREEATRWASRNGYRIIGEYVDEGISGDDTGRRERFKQMVEDVESGIFQAVLCTDVDRFGRFDIVDAAEWIKPLRKAGIHLATVNQGRMDWEGPMGLLFYTLHQSGAKEYLTKLSRRVADGMRNKAREGRPLGGQAPYGYAWQYAEFLESNKPVMRPVGLTPGDPKQIAAVQDMYRRYGETDTSLRTIMLDLNGRGVLSPGGKKWYISTVRGILTNPVYKGTYAWNRKHMGKYHGVEGGETKAKRLSKTTERNPERDWFTREGAHEALVPTSRWEAVQSKLVSRRGRRTPLVGGGDFLLTGLVYCMHCGRDMFNHANVRGVKRYPGLICKSYMLTGDCRRYRINQAPLVSTVLRLIERAFSDPARLASLKAEIRRLLAQRSGGDPARRRALERQISELSAKVEQGVENLLTAPADLRELMTAKLRELQERECALRRELAALRRPAASDKELDAAVDEATGLLSRLQAEVEAADPARVRELLRQVVSRIDCWFDVVPYGKKSFTPLSRGVVHLRPGLICKDDLLGGPSNMPTGETRL